MHNIFLISHCLSLTSFLSFLFPLASHNSGRTGAVVEQTELQKFVNLPTAKDRDQAIYLALADTHLEIENARIGIEAVSHQNVRMTETLGELLAQTTDLTTKVECLAFEQMDLKKKLDFVTNAVMTLESKMKSSDDSDDDIEVVNVVEKKKKRRAVPAKLKKDDGGLVKKAPGFWRFLCPFVSFLKYFDINIFQI